MNANETWEKKVGLADMHGTVARISYMPPDETDDEPYVALSIQSGAANVSASATPEALRQLAAALLDGADALES